MMKHLLLLFCCLLFACQLANAQQSTTLRAGANIQPNYLAVNVQEYKTTVQYGVFLELDDRKKWNPTFTLNYFCGKSKSERTGLLFGTDPGAPSNPGTFPGFSTSVISIKEHGLDLAVVLNRYITMKKLNPFVGFGLDVQIPLIATRNSYILHPSGYKEELRGNAINLGFLNPGVILQVGNRTDLTEELSIFVQLGSKSTLITNAKYYKTAIEVSESIPISQSFFIQVGASYKLGSKKQSS